MAVQVDILHEFKPFLEQDATSSKDQVSLICLKYFLLFWSSSVLAFWLHIGILECDRKPTNWGSAGAVCARQPCGMAGGP